MVLAHPTESKACGTFGDRHDKARSYGTGIIPVRFKSLVGPDGFVGEEQSAALPWRIIVSIVSSR